jgi:hypothetical protein
MARFGCFLNFRAILIYSAKKHLLALLRRRDYGFALVRQSAPPHRTDLLSAVAPR